MNRCHPNPWKKMFVVLSTTGDKKLIEIWPSSRTTTEHFKRKFVFMMTKSLSKLYKLHNWSMKELDDADIDFNWEIFDISIQISISIPIPISISIWIGP